MLLIKITTIALMSFLFLGCNEESQLNMAKDHLKQKNYKQAYKIFSSLAIQDNAEAQFFLGRMYYYGQGTKQDKKLSIKWIHKAVKKENSDAQFILAVWYFSGTEVKQDYKRAFSLMKQSADAGNPAAMEHLASMYSHGQGVMQNEKNAVRYIRKASRLKRPLAQYLLAIAEEGPVDYRKKVQLLTNSAINGYDIAQFTVGMFALSINKNKLAERWFNVAVKQGNITPSDIDDARKYVTQLSKKYKSKKHFILIVNYVEKLRRKLHNRKLNSPK